MALTPTCYIGTAGWAVGSSAPAAFKGPGTHLERYAAVLNAVEVNSTFYRLPLARTLVRWAATTPDHFRFALKMPKAVTHDRKVFGAERPLRAFLDLLPHLGEKCGPVLVQLPPSLIWSERTAAFLDGLRELYAGPVAVEPRHASWYALEARSALRRCRMACVAADPPRGIDRTVPGGDTSLVYYRLHGSPRTYWSAYTPEEVRRWGAAVRAHQAKGAAAWLIFDNTAQGYALHNALQAQRYMVRSSKHRY